MTLPVTVAAALLLFAPSMQPLADAPTTAVATVKFAPPLGRTMTYRVTTRRIGRDGSPVIFTLAYTLQWQRLGRGYQLEAVLDRIESDAPPAVARALTLMLQPLIGERLTYLVPVDGSRIDLVDPEGVWVRVTARVEAVGANGNREEARRLAALIAALPDAERDRLATADVRALLVPANAIIGQAVTEDAAANGPLRTMVRVERDGRAGSVPLRIDQRWTIDTATGLVMRERRQSWVTPTTGGEPMLAEERLRVLEPAPEIGKVS
ncbi:hypothetical protein [Sphingopyxis solisilvae]|uniref:hypothetical protein n=1 Tax=Sphingopyxis solisilvae TaxID=1886788 RepID=UPI001892D159|nr:hypothetical protein [Sphingopyxis solisilvae]